MNLESHLKERYLERERYNGIMVFQEDQIVIFPLWNLSGQMVGYQQYRPNASKEKRNDPREGRYYTSLHGNKNEKPIGVWGLESLDYNPNILIVVEGIFDAVRIHNQNVPCVALLNSSYKYYKNWLTCLGRKIYKIEDDHGSSLGPYEEIKIPNHRIDLGDCSITEVENICSNLMYVK